MYQDLLGMELGLRDIVFDMDPATPSKNGTPIPANFLAHFYCGQMAGWVKTPFGTEVDLGPDHIVLDGSQLLRKGHSPRSFRRMSIVVTVAHLSYC